MLEIVTKPFKLAYEGYKLVKSARKAVKLWFRKPAYGSAGWATSKDVNLEPTGFAVGKIGGWWSKRKIYTDPESCVIMVGQRGAGKSLTMGATLREANGQTLIVFDPPAQLMAAHEDSLKAKGYGVFHVDLMNPSNGAKFDPMAILEHSNVYSIERDIDTVARLVVGEAEDVGESAGQHFAEMSVNLVAGVIAYLWEHDKANCTMSEVANILSVGGPNKRRLVFDQMRVHATNPAAKAAVNAFDEAGDREKGSFSTSMMRKLKPWTTRAYQDLCVRGSGWTWDGMFTSQQPVAFFITGGVGQRESISAVTRQMIGQAAATLSRLYGEAGPLARPVMMLLDEFDSLGNCGPVVNVITELRKQNVTVFMAVQSLEQIRRNYKGQYETIKHNCDMIVCGGMKAPKEYLEISQLIGTRTINPITKGKASVSTGEAPRALIGVDDLYRMSSREHIALLGNKSIKLEKPFEIKGGKVVY